MFQTIRPHLIVKLVHVMASCKRWNDFSSDDEEPDKILSPGILSRSIGGVDSEAHQALHNVLMSKHAFHTNIGVSGTAVSKEALT